MLSTPLLLLALVLPIAHAGYLLQLSDLSFEHLTQSTTGSTTGSYLVHFHSTPIDIGSGLYSIFSDLSTAEDNNLDDYGVILATVFLPSSPALTTRFQSILTSPLSGPHGDTLTFIHQGQVYTHKLPDGDIAGDGRFKDELFQWATGGFREGRPGVPVSSIRRVPSDEFSPSDEYQAPALQRTARETNAA